MTLVLLVHLAATWYMAGVIWLVQLVHYPLFEQYDDDAFITTMQRHQKLTTWVVAPGMFAEVFSGAWLVLHPPLETQRVGWLVGLGLLLVIWISTAALQVPCHHRLLQGYDAAVHRRLVRSNWLRTIAWTARGLLVGWLVMQIA